MSGNSNPSINSPASTDHELDTLVRDDAIIAANLLQEFNNRQARHISISSTDSSSVQYVPHSLTDTTWAVANSLIATIHCRSAVADQRLAESRRCINQLQGMVHAREAEIRRIRSSNATPEMLAGYERNGGQVDIQVSSHGGENVVARWI